MSEGTVQLVFLEYNRRGKSDKAKDRWDEITMDLTFHDKKLELFLVGDERF